MKYTVLCEFASDGPSGVNYHLANGWKLYGNPFGIFDPITKEVILYQAMTKEEEN